MGCGCPDVRVSVFLPGGGPWNFKRATSGTYELELVGVGTMADTSAPVQSLQYLQQFARPWEICDCKAAWLLVDVRALPDETDLVDEAVWLWGVGPIGGNGLGWSMGGPLGVIGFQASVDLAIVGAAGWNLSLVSATNVVVAATPALAVEDAAGTNALIFTGAANQGAENDLQVEGTAPIAVALPNPAPVSVPLPVGGWSFALRLPADGGLGAVVQRGVVLTFSGRSCAHSEA